MTEYQRFIIKAFKDLYIYLHLASITEPVNVNNIEHYLAECVLIYLCQRTQGIIILAVGSDRSQHQMHYTPNSIDTKYICPKHSFGPYHKTEPIHMVGVNLPLVSHGAFIKTMTIGLIPGGWDYFINISPIFVQWYCQKRLLLILILNSNSNLPCVSEVYCGVLRATTTKWIKHINVNTNKRLFKN